MFPGVRWRALPGAAILALAAAVLTGCGTNVISSPEKGTGQTAVTPPHAIPVSPEASPPPDSPALSAEARTAEAGARAPEVARPVPLGPAGDSYVSNLYVERDVKVAARASGVIDKIYVDRGASVKAGQPLAALETDVPAQEVAVAEDRKSVV